MNTKTAIAALALVAMIAFDGYLAHAKMQSDAEQAKIKAEIAATDRDFAAHPVMVTPVEDHSAEMVLRAYAAKQFCKTNDCTNSAPLPAATVYVPRYGGEYSFRAGGKLGFHELPP